ncbi:hypothetical protein Y032_0041g379 [Ancylostoma ceylanicum]|uniref:Uncharacterized protein n=1 Tax=Ancylostoma ceylanicum TaxID=53326 RepID=A0A016UG85_9BILA|nr:hypothetical protein Y032_0041g379 [Ancylostoma ceylanicum]
MPALTVFVAYAPASSCDEDEIETFYMVLKKFYWEDHRLFKVIVGHWVTSKPRLALEERLKNFTLLPTAYSGTNRERGSPSSS